MTVALRLPAPWGGGGQPLSPPSSFVGKGLHEVEGFEAVIGEVPESHLLSGYT
jgi:hypothetical protein